MFDLYSQLARQSEVANATISQVESGKVSPTVSMLKKVLDGIPLSLGEFLSESTYHNINRWQRANTCFSLWQIIVQQWQSNGLRNSFGYAPR